MSPSVLEHVKATDTKLKGTKPQDPKAAASESQEDNAEKKNASDLESVDRFDTQNLLSAHTRCNFWDAFLESTD